MVAFDNTEIAFKGRSTAELDRAQLLFKLVGNPALVNVGKSALELAISLHLPVTEIIRSTVFNHFCGGESVADCEKSIERLHKAGVFTLLDYSAEGKSTEKDFEFSASEVIRTIGRASHDARIPFAVFKPTGLMRASLLERVSGKRPLEPHQQMEWDSAMNRVRKICEAAFESKVPVLIDAEESWLQNAIDGLVEAMMLEFNRNEAIVYNTFQLYRNDRLAYLRESHQRAQNAGYILGAKLVRGAYMEKERERAKKKGYPSPIHASKKETDDDYNAASLFCVQNIKDIRLIAGTHNEDSSRKLMELMHDAHLAENDSRIFYSQLYGMSDNISFNLAHAGFNVVKYVPYGPVKLVMPYLIRRAEENTSVAGQVGRELSLILKEKQRRRNQR
jgi:proline dehydrogenase